jgi:hypothetical protein
MPPQDGDPTDTEYAGSAGPQTCGDQAQSTEVDHAHENGRRVHNSAAMRWRRPSFWADDGLGMI